MIVVGSLGGTFLKAVKGSEICALGICRPAGKVIILGFFNFYCVPIEYFIMSRIVLLLFRYRKLPRSRKSSTREYDVIKLDILEEGRRTTQLFTLAQLDNIIPNHHGRSFERLRPSNARLSGHRLRLRPAALSTNNPPRRGNSAQELFRSQRPTPLQQGITIHRR